MSLPHYRSWTSGYDEEEEEEEEEEEDDWIGDWGAGVRVGVVFYNNNNLNDL